MKITNKNTPIILFIEGLASISIQFLTMRQVIPFVGGSVITASIIISIFLGALAFGYERGGKTKIRHKEKLSLNLILAGLWLGVFLSYPFVSLFFSVLSSQSEITNLFLFTLFAIAPVVFWVAQTIPILTNFIKANTSGEQAGNALLFSTIGNVIGGVFTSMVIIYFLGVSWGIIINASVFILLGIFLSSKKKKTTLFFLPLIGLLFFLNTTGTKNFIDEETVYSNYKTIEQGKIRYFLINESYSSKINTKTNKGFAYIEEIKEEIARHIHYYREKELLILGAGGFTLGKEEPNLDCTYVDIDRKIKEIAEKYFLEERIKGKFIEADALVFLKKTKKKYDVVISDVYQNKMSIPEHLSTVEFYREAKNKLKKNGIFIANIIQDPFTGSKFSQRIRNTIYTAFDGGCYTTVVTDGQIREISNVLYVCKVREKKGNDNTIYTQEKGEATIDFFNK